MKHISKIDGATYNISFSVEYETDKHDDITLIWKSPACSFEEAEQHNIPLTVLVGWYYGGYDYNIVEQCIADYYLNKLAIKPKASPSECYKQLVNYHGNNTYKIITQLFMTQEIMGLFQYQEVNDKVLDALFEYYSDSDYNILELFDAIDSYCFDNDMTFEDYLKAKGYLD